MNETIKNHSICVRITTEESKMVEILRDKHCVNMSKFIRKFITLAMRTIRSAKLPG